MGLLSSLGLAPRSEVAALSARLEAQSQEIAALETRVRMRSTASGVPITYGQFDYEYLSNLSGDGRWDVYDKMESDPHIKQGLDSVVLPLKTGRWEIQAASDKPIDVEIADFVQANLLRQASDRFGREYWCDTSWSGQRLPEILDMLKCGFAMFNKSTRAVDGKIVYDRLQWLEPRSVDPRGWELDKTDRIIRVLRTYSDAMDQFQFRDPIGAVSIALYTWDPKGARYEGRSRIRSCYGAWMRKDAVLRYAVIWAQKAGAPIPVLSYPAGYSPELRTKVDAAARMMRNQSPAEAYAIFPMGADGEKVDVNFAGAEHGEVDRLRGLINGENAEISHGFGTTGSKLLGETKTGSRAVGETQSEDEDIVVQAVAQTVCDLENGGIGNLPGLIPQLVSWNYPGVRNFPQLVVTRIGPREDLSTLAPLIEAIKAGVVPLIPAVRRQVTEKFGIELKDEDYEIEPVVPGQGKPGEKPVEDAKTKAAALPFGGPAPEGQNGDLDDRERAAASLGLEDVRARIAPMLEQDPNAAKIGARRPTRLEASYCSLAAVQESYRVGSNDLHQELRVIRDDMIRDLMGRLRAGKISSRSLGSMRQSRFRGDGRAIVRVQTVMRRVGDQGQEHAEMELRRQEGRA